MVRFEPFVVLILSSVAFASAACSDSSTDLFGTGGASTTAAGGTVTTGASGAMSTGAATSAGSTGSTSASSSGSGATGSGGNASVGLAPTAKINHPGDMETRAANSQVPFVGTGDDPEDGMLSGASLVWKSNISGQLGTGQSFNAALPVGTHTVTLTATDSNGNVGTDAITLFIQ